MGLRILGFKGFVFCAYRRFSPSLLSPTKRIILWILKSLDHQIISAQTLRSLRLCARTVYKKQSFSIALSRVFPRALRPSFFYSRAEAQRAQRLRRGIYIIRRKGAFGLRLLQLAATPCADWHSLSTSVHCLVNVMGRHGAEGCLMPSRLNITRLCGDECSSPFFFPFRFLCHLQFFLENRNV